MLDQNLKKQVVSVFSSLKANYSFKLRINKDHEKRQEFVALLEDVTSTSEKLSLQVVEEDAFALNIQKDGETSAITFRAIPTGHEFTTLLLAILNMDGTGKNLPDDMTSSRIKSLTGDITIKSYISLTCTNCPDVVQALNIIAILNPNIKHEIIDGSVNKEEVNALNIQAVPSVYMNGEALHVGRSSLSELLEKIENLAGSTYQPTEEVEREYDVVVVGGGPAGVSSAVYSARKGFSVAIVADAIGGQVKETVDIENMIATPKTTGSELAASLKLHLDDYAIDILENRKVEKTEVIDGVKQIHTSLGEVISTPSLIIATGASWRKLGVPGEEDYIGSGVAFCTHCDGPFYKGKDVAVIGGGNSGLEAAIDLSSIANKVTVLEFADVLRGDQVLQEKIASLPNVSIITEAQTLNIDGDGKKVTALTYKNRASETEETLKLDGVFVQIGLTANSSVFSNIVDTNRMGEIEIDPNCRTKVPGIYAAGDVTTVPYKQIIIAMGEGAKAALSSFDDNIKGLQIG